MKIKKGDTVKVMKGKDRGKTGTVLQTLPALNRVSVAGINVLTKHLRSNKRGIAGQKIEFPSPIEVSNVMLVCPSCGKSARTGSSASSDPNAAKTRVCKKCAAAI